MESAETQRILVVGAGVAGVSVALWLRSLGMAFEWVAAGTQIGGTLHRVGNPIENFAGRWVPNGSSLVEALKKQLCQLQLQPRLRVRVHHIERTPKGFLVTVEKDRRRDQQTYQAVALCTGTRARRLGLDGEKQLWRRGVDNAVSRNLVLYAGTDVAVVGGGDGALEGALLLAKQCRSVHLVHRGVEFTAQRRFIRQVEEHDRIFIHKPAIVRRLLIENGVQKLSGIELDTGEVLHVECLFERLGVNPVLPEGIDAALLDDDGYLKTDSRGVSCWARLYGAGDVTGRAHQSVAYAVGSGARVAQSVQEDLGERY